MNCAGSQSRFGHLCLGTLPVSFARLRAASLRCSPRWFSSGSSTKCYREETGLLLCAAGLIFLSYQGKTALTSVGNYLTLNAVQKMALQLRMDVLRHLDQLSADYYENTPPGAV